VGKKARIHTKGSFSLFLSFLALSAFLTHSELSETVEASGTVVTFCVLAVMILWFSKAYKFLRTTGIHELKYPVTRVVLSFILPIKNLYEPAKNMKTIWIASEAGKRKNVIVSAGFGIWWLFFIFSRLDKFGLPYVDAYVTTVVNILTVLLVIKVNTRLSIIRKRYQK
jgi:hypothetical protein